MGERKDTKREETRGRAQCFFSGETKRNETGRVAHSSDRRERQRMERGTNVLRRGR